MRQISLYFNWTVALPLSSSVDAPSHTLITDKLSDAKASDSLRGYSDDQVQVVSRPMNLSLPTCRFPRVSVQDLAYRYELGPAVIEDVGGTLLRELQGGMCLHMH